MKEEKKENYEDILKRFNKMAVLEVLAELKTTRQGLSEKEAHRRRMKWGRNEMVERKKLSIIRGLASKFASPLIITLLIVAVFSYFFGEKMSALLVILMAVLSAILSFFQEYKAQKNMEKLREMVHVSVRAVRDGKARDIKFRHVAPGDIIELTAGDLAPADLRIIESKDLFINQAALNGESFPAEKWPAEMKGGAETIFELDAIALAGSSVVSGAALGAVIATGKRTMFGQLAAKLVESEPETAFDTGIKKFTWLMIKFILVLSLFIFLANAVLKGDLVTSLLFALAVAVGLTPDMLPMVIAINLSRGALRMAKKKIIIKRLDSIQNFGAMDILCADKTGTLTLDEVILIKHCDAEFKENEDVFRDAYINSFYQTAMSNLLDKAVIKHGKFDIGSFKKIDEIPFDFFRRMVSVVVEKEGEHKLIIKGAPEEIFSRCGHYELSGEIYPLDKEKVKQFKKKYEELSADGFRVLSVAFRNFKVKKEIYTKDDESDLIFRGYVAFLDPPKPSSLKAVKDLEELGVKLKILTGDNEQITKKICQEVGMPVEGVLNANDVDKLSDEALIKAVEGITIFVRLQPLQKERIIRALRAGGHVVSFLGDGINDAPAMKAADTGVSVDNAADIAKETADIILLERSLTVLADCVREGRKAFSNTLKYIKMGASSNFGNMLSMAGASLFLPFLPMLPAQILFANFLYDLSQVAIPTDNVDSDYLLKPRPWNIKFIKKFILTLGPVSSIFDFLTFGVMWFVFRASPELFRTGWFVESLITQILVVYVIRTKKIPFLQSRPSAALLISTLAIVLFGAIAPHSPLAKIFGFAPLPATFFLILLGIAVAYLLLAQLVKSWFIKRFGYE